MINHFDMAREMARLVRAGKTAGETLLSETRRMFPEATPADHKRAVRILIERVEILEEELRADARRFEENWFKGVDPKTMDMLIELYVRDNSRLKPTVENLFPKPDKSKS